MRYLLLAVLLTGCATGTRVVEYGPVTPVAPLVTLVVTDSLEVVQRECKGAPHAAGTRLAGCQLTTPVPPVPGSPFVRQVRIVRYTDTLPSAMALEIEAHELCHAVAALQFIADPCHRGNHGQVEVVGAPRARAAR